MTRLTRDDIVTGAGRRFAMYGYHGTSMRDLGEDLGILGSSIYAHVGGKQELLVAVVERGAALFDASASTAMENGVDPMDTLERLVAGHVDVVLDHRSEARTYLAEVSSLDDEDRSRISSARDAYENVFVQTIASAQESRLIRSEADPRLAAIYVLSVLNALERWYDEDGRLSRSDIVSNLFSFIRGALCHGSQTA